MSLLMPNIGVAYPRVVAAKGPWLRDSSGQEWIDGSSGAIACSIGHGHPRVVEAVREQMATLSFAYRTQFANEPALALADRLCDRLGYSAAFFVNSGSEAVETAVRLAQQYWKELGQATKTRVLSRRISYHGSTTGALALSGHWPRRRASGPLPFEPTLPTPYPLRTETGMSPVEAGRAAASAIEDEILRVGAQHVAGIIIEPIVGASGGVIVPPDGYLQAVREVCDRHDVLLIGDEVLTGLGRAGHWLAMDHGCVKADIVCLGKGLNAGYFPISGVLANRRIQSALAARKASFSLGHTHSNHPVGAAVAHAVLDVLETDALVHRATTVGGQLGSRLAAMAAEHGSIAEVRGSGMLWGLELVHDTVTFEPWPSEARIADRVVRAAFAEGLLLYPSTGFIAGSRGDAVIVAPPLNTPQDVLDEIVVRLDRALTNALSGLSMATRKESNHVQDAA